MHIPEFKPLADFDWLTPQYNYKIFVIENNNCMNTCDKKMCRYKNDFVCCNRQSPVEKLIAMAGVFDKKDPKGWDVDVSESNDKTKVFEVFEVVGKGGSSAQQKFFNCNWQTDLIKIKPETSGGSKRSYDDDDDGLPASKKLSYEVLDADLKKTSEKVCSANFMTSVPSLSEFVTTMKKSSMENTEFQILDLEKLRNGFNFEGVSNHLNTLDFNSGVQRPNDLKFSIIFKNFYLATNLLEQYLQVQQNFSALLINFSADTAALVMFIIIGKLALQHFYKYPLKYIFDNAAANPDAVAARVNDILDPTGYFVNIVSFCNIIQTPANATKFNREAYTRAWYHFFLMNQDNPFLYLFEPVHILRSSTTNFYLGIIMVYFLYWLAGDATI